MRMGSIAPAYAAGPANRLTLCDWRVEARSWGTRKKLAPAEGGNNMSFNCDRDTEKSSGESSGAEAFLLTHADRRDLCRMTKKGLKFDGLSVLAPV